MRLTTPLLPLLSIGFGTGCAIPSSQDVAVAAATTTTAIEPAWSLRISEPIDGIPSDLHSTTHSLKSPSSTQGHVTMTHPKPTTKKVATNEHDVTTHRALPGKSKPMGDLKKRHLVARSDDGRPPYLSPNLRSTRQKTWDSVELVAGYSGGAGGSGVGRSAADKILASERSMNNHGGSSRSERFAGKISALQGTVSRFTGKAKSTLVPLAGKAKTTLIPPQPLRPDAFEESDPHAGTTKTYPATPQGPLRPDALNAYAIGRAQSTVVAPRLPKPKNKIKKKKHGPPRRGA